MRRLRNWVLGLLAVFLALLLALGSIGYLFVRRTFPQVTGSVQVLGADQRVEIYRDEWGVPHIYAHNEHDLFFAQGYVHAQDRLWQMEFNRRVGAGRLSEVMGQATLESDRFLRTIGLYRAAQADLQVLPREVMEALQAYADGVNAFMDTHLDRLPLEFTLLGFQPEHWTPTDTLVWGKVMAMDLGGNWENELLWRKLIAAIGKDRVRELVPAYPEDGPFIIPAEVKSYAYQDQELRDDFAQVKLLLGMLGVGLGSNNWVVDGTKTASGRPMLANDTHLGIQMPSIWYEIHLQAGDLDVVGFSFPGAPGVIIGHNRNIAWGVTNAGPDVQDLYVEKVNPENPDQYEYMGMWEDMTLIEEEIRVKGWSEPDALTVRLTRHGPIMTPVMDGAVEVVSLRWTALEGGQLFRSMYLLDRADNWEEFRTALRYWQSPSQNFVYADIQGNIGYQMPGNIPIRAKGDGLVPVPGWTGEYEWTGYIPFEELPFVLNPDSHLIVTANNKVVPEDYPYFISHEWAEPFRASRITELLQAKDKLTPEDMRDIQADTYSAPASTLGQYLLTLAPADWRQERAFRFLEDWDGNLDSSSGAAGICQVMFWRMLVNTFSDEVSQAGLSQEEFIGLPTSLLGILDQLNNSWFDDITTSDLESRDDIMHRSAAETIDFWGRRYGDLPGNKDEQWAWGKIHTATFEHVLGSVKPLDLIFNRGPVSTPGSGETVNAAGYRPGDFSQRVVASQRQIIDVGEWRNSLSQHTTGQSGQPFHKHYDDMITPWRNVRHHAMLYEKEDVLAHSEGLLVLEPK